MGFSAATAAFNALEALLAKQEPAYTTDGKVLGGSWMWNGSMYFVEENRKDNPTMSLTGKVLKMTSRRPDGSGTAEVVGSFRIDANGKVCKFPCVKR